MRYAVNNYDITKFTQTLVTHIQNHLPTTWWALVDRGFDYDTHNKLDLTGYNHFFVYQDDLIDLRRISPVVLELSSEEENLHKQLLHLLTHCQGKPMLSFISADLPKWDLESKIQILQKFMAPEGEEYFLRFADTRTLEALEHILLEDNYCYFAHGITEWISPGRSGELVHYKFDKYKVSDEKSYEYFVRINALQKMYLQEKEFYEILEYSESDIVFQHLFEHHSDHFAHRNSYDLWQDVHTVRSYLKAIAIEDNAILLYLVFILHERLGRDIIQQEKFKTELVTTKDPNLFVKNFYLQLISK